jgi:hypothetical protein
MSYHSTPNFTWQIPNQGTQTGVWGTDMDNFADAVDATTFSIQTTANAALPKGGGSATGLTNQFTETVKLVAKGSVAGAQTLDLSTAQYFTITNSGAGIQFTPTGFTNPPATASAAFPLMIRITNGGLGTGVSWPASAKFPGGTAPVLSTAGTDLVAFISDDAGTTYRMAGFQKALA